VARRLSECWWEGRLLVLQSRAALGRGDSDAAIVRLEEAVRLARQSGDAWSLAMSLSQSGDLARAAGAYAQAGELYAESLALHEAPGLGGTGTPTLWHNLGYVSLASGDGADARARFAEDLRQFQRLGERHGMSDCVIGLAAVAAVEGHAETAAQLFGAAEAEMESLRSQIWHSNRADYERSLQLLRAALPADVLKNAWAASRALTWEEAVRLALGAE
jgi:tetratricopeptide (TPR) repeat protein